ncbi:hypothetical protein THRCLA_00817 [Thraustotheca clavata]|uniref:Thioesterase n=1 Tax=Thraustotheca clavata TaxID=74557 RepID=A0A1W0AAI3_9STRA|nr:hypothetical protein THRCLA_00817 [Thraustotheca clavata]
MTLAGGAIVGLLSLVPLTIYAIALFVLECSHGVCMLLAALGAFAAYDVWYFIDMFIYQVHLAVLPQPTSPKIGLMDTHLRHLRVTLNDIDRNGHCNNARYLRECGAGRRDFWKANGVWDIIRKHGGNLVVGAQTVRYRRELALWQSYTLETRVLAWDDRAYYVEHRFVSTENPPFIHAIVLVKNNVLGAKRPHELVSIVAKDQVQPAIPEEVALWIKSNQVSSAKLRPKKQ